MGFGRNVVETNAQRLDEANLIKVTRSHFLPLDDQVCQEAADSMMEEILAELGE